MSGVPRPADLDADLVAQVTRWRHDLHRIPETGFAEHRTGDYLAAELEALGLPVTRGIGGTGLVATVHGDGPDAEGRAIALRADMDALPIPERNDVPYRSTHEGVMHACGHDGHMAMLLVAGQFLARQRAFRGSVHLVFQPAEEHGLGARAMIADGLFDRFPVRAMYGLHNLPGSPAGTLHTRSGAFMAGEDTFEIRVAGRGGHASQPQMVVDPIVVAAEIVLAVQTIVARNLHPADAAVVSCTGVTTDGARNAIPSEVVVTGDARSFSPAVRATLEHRLRTLAEGIAAAHGATCRVTYTHEFEPTVNDPAATAQAVAAARATVGDTDVDDDCPPLLASEDFGAYAQIVPACFVGLGNGTVLGAGGTPLHSHDYDLNDAVLPVGVAFHATLVRRLLGREDR